MGEKEKRAIKDIKKHGCHILHVLEENNYPRFSYSIGIQKSSGHPEIIITGLKRDLAHFIINEYNNRVKCGEVFIPDKYYSDFIDNFNIVFKIVDIKYYAEYFGWAKWLYNGDDFKVLQLIYPSTSGIWPWDQNAPDDFKWFIPKLYVD